MAAPADTTIKNLNGSWVMDSTLSDPADPLLALQGMSWFLRKALPYATVTLHVSEYADSTNPQVYHIDVDQVITGGITGSKEARQLDWQEREHVDNIFGTLRGKSRFLRGSKADDGKVRPAVDFQTKVGDAEKDAKVQRFLRGEVLLDGAATEGFVVDEEGAEFGEGEGLWMQSFVVNEQKGWTAEQIWGFEVVDGQRRHTRRVAVTKGSQVELSRLVYKFEGPKPE
ncbi:uncharacterized protein N7473_002283 [Penicillium subrubescens]|jgi:hypothetical protein|uniref:Uncharacterized protein n=1 Tax=Penicillium subrubescens TaxID=1316194 RepID=A0A1Q5SXL6_9EURO|nr:uncharacterized protein N7473_002283 [Penicillium subrubescens]KAJ5905367.1 hypothetical protein N7473_002283 [Penicillium subrubescens]OKO92734.1 hypothetical protein PENSUB_12719 [Penicillium subrubescens]